MSDSCVSIVPKQSVYPNKESMVEEILEWLILVDVVKATPSDCVLGSNLGHAVSEGAKVVTEQSHFLPFDLTVNGLEVISKRQVFHTGQNGIDELVCPHCKDDLVNEEWNFLDEWADYISNNLTCPPCSIPSEIHLYKFRPVWGFSDLGFTFWNWPQLTVEFIDEFKNKLGCEVDIVYSKI